MKVLKGFFAPTPMNNHLSYPQKKLSIICKIKRRRETRSFPTFLLFGDLFSPQITVCGCLWNRIAQTNSLLETYILKNAY